MSDKLSCHDHGNCELCDFLEAEHARLKDEITEWGNRVFGGQSMADEIARLESEVAALQVVLPALHEVVGTFPELSRDLGRLECFERESKHLTENDPEPIASRWLRWLDRMHDTLPSLAEIERLKK